MSHRLGKPDMTRTAGEARDNIAYMRQILGELRVMAKDEGAEMLSYLIEMAYVEAGDLVSGHIKTKKKVAAAAFKPHGGI